MNGWIWNDPTPMVHSCFLLIWSFWSQSSMLSSSHHPLLNSPHPEKTSPHISQHCLYRGCFCSLSSLFRHSGFVLLVCAFTKHEAYKQPSALPTCIQQRSWNLLEKTLILQEWCIISISTLIINLHIYNYIIVYCCYYIVINIYLF